MMDLTQQDDPARDPNNAKDFEEQREGFAKAYKIFWDNVFETGETKDIFQFELTFPSHYSVADALEEAIKAVNDELANKNQEDKKNYGRLVVNPDIFKLQYAKKTGLPSSSIPAFDHLQIIKNTKCDRFVFYHITDEALKWPKAVVLDSSRNDASNTQSMSRQKSFTQTVTQKFCCCFYRTVTTTNGNYQAITPEE